MGPMPSPEEGIASLGDADRAALAEIARGSLVAAVRGDVYRLDGARLSGALARHGASFVTLHENGALRGCIGSIEPRRPLAEDVAANAAAAALHDARFAPVEPRELPFIEVELSVLSPLEWRPVASERELFEILEPGVHGLLLEAGPRRATFLPAVWEQLPEPRDFVAQLKRKAGLPADGWSPSFRCSFYRVEAFAAGRALGD